jgi:membrane protease YdiL (CAAX protease family)
MTSERKAGLILGGIAVIECGWVALNLWINGWRFVRYLGFAPGLYGNTLGWIAVGIVVALFVGFALRLPSVRQNLFRISSLKMLAIAVAVGAGILEEVVFRRWTMNWLMTLHYGVVVQVLGSALLFGVAHGVWGLFGRSLSAAMGATIATGTLGAMLAVVFLLSGRSLAPCIAAHFFINLLIEPGLVLAAVRGEMKRT